jgi:hypothetical protein
MPGAYLLLETLSSLHFRSRRAIFRIALSARESKIAGNNPVMSLANNLANKYESLRQTIGRAILRYAPRHGSLDTIFHSYDDWRELQEQRPNSAPDPSREETPAVATRSQAKAQRGPKPRHAFE